MSKPLPNMPNSIQQRIERRQKWMKMVRYGVFLPGMLIGAITGLGALLWPSVTHVETGATRQYSDIQPQFLDRSTESIVLQIQEIVAETPRLQMNKDMPVLERPNETELHLKAKGPLLPTTTDLRVTVHQSSSSGRSVVRMRASGSGGKTDFGQNARNIRFLQRELQERR